MDFVGEQASKFWHSSGLALMYFCRAAPDESDFDCRRFEVD
jgi:hypothetical protein